MLKLSIYSLIILAFFVNSLVGYGLVPYAFSWSIELIIMLLFFVTMGRKALTKVPIHLFGLPFVALFCVVSFVSAYLNSTSAFWLLLFLRQCLRFYLLLWILQNLDLSEQLMLRTHKLLIFLFVIQIPTAVIKMFIYGQGETAIGTYAIHGGGNSAVIPMIATSFIICYHYLYRKRSVSWILLLGFLAFGIIGGKRAIVFLVPLSLIFAYFVISKEKSREILQRTIKIAVYIAISCAVIFYCGIRILPALNPEHKIGGRFSINYVISYIQSYNRGTSGPNRLSYGRIETTERIYYSLLDTGPETFLFGKGPGTFMKSSFGGRDKYYFKQQLSTVGVVYGISTLNFLALQVGYIGAAIWIVFFVYAMIMLNRFANSETDPYWKAYFNSLVCFSFVALVISSIYNNVFLEDDLMAMVYMMLLSFAIRRYNLLQRSYNKSHVGYNNPNYDSVGVSKLRRIN